MNTLYGPGLQRTVPIWRRHVYATTWKHIPLRKCCWMNSTLNRCYCMSVISTWCIIRCVWLPCSEVCQRNYRPRKFVTVSCWVVDSCVLLSEAWRHVCRPTRCLLLRRQRSSVVCQLSTVCVYSCITSIPSIFSRYYDRRAGRATPVLCPASVSNLYIARSLPGEQVHVMSVSERLCWLSG